MAVIYCRPNADTSLKHSVYGGSSVGYNKINDVTADDNSTYIYTQAAGAKKTSHSSNFGMTCALPNTKCTVTEAQILFRAKSGTFSTATVNVSASVNGKWNNASTGTKTVGVIYSDYSVNSGNLVKMLNESLAAGTMPMLGINVASVCDMSSQSSSKSAEQLRITQIYIKLTYTTGATIYTKSGGTYGDEKSVLGVWTKKNGAYVQEDDIAAAFDENTAYIFE